MTTGNNNLEEFDGALELPEDFTAPDMSETVLEKEDLEVTLSEKTAVPLRDLEENLTEQELRIVDDFSKKIDITNSAHILQYGAASQKKLVSFSENALSKVKGKDLDDVGNMIESLVVNLKDFSPEEQEKQGFFARIFKKGSNTTNQLKAKYSSVESNVNMITQQLETHKVTLLKDIAMLDKMYDMNLDYYKELTMYIIAGRKKLNEVETQQLPKLREKAELSKDTQDAQAVNDLAAQINRFDKKLYDLELTRNISIQMGPQIRMVQNNDAVMVEKIQSSIVNTIPLWKNQMVLTLGLSHSQKAVQAQRQVSDVTNELLRKNAEKLKTTTIETAKESERGIVDIETLQMTNQSLISTLDEVLRIQQEGYQKRRQAETELQRIENELKDKLLEIRDVTDSPAPNLSPSDETFAPPELEI